MKLHENKESMELLISNISERTGVREDVLEKDYYVTLLLKELSEKNNQNYAYFKGGTALYKALKSIRRFSEDIDLTVYVEDVSTPSQEQKRLKIAVKDFESLEFKEKSVDKKANMEVSYKYDPIFFPDTNDTLQRFGNVKIEATSFTVSKPVEFMEISPHLYELANKEEKEILENVFDVKPFKIGTISLERIFIDKIFASEFYFVRDKFLDLAKHIYDITVMCSLDRICNLLSNDEELIKLIGYKRKEETHRQGGIPQDLEIKDFSYLNDIAFYESEQFKKALNTIHNIYVFDKKDKIDIEQIQETLNMLHYIFSDFVTAKKIVNEKKKESDMEM